MIMLQNVFVFLLLADFSFYLLHNRSLHTDIITEMDFLGEGVRLEGERGRVEGRGWRERKPLLHLFINHKSVYFSLETRPIYQSPWLAPSLRPVLEKQGSRAEAAEKRERRLP